MKLAAILMLAAGLYLVGNNVIAGLAACATEEVVCD